MQRLLLVACLVLGLNAFISVDPTTRLLIDELGRTRMFHGVNVVYKGAPWIPVLDHFDWKTSFSEEDMQILQKMGMNVIRLGTMWPGVEPVRGQYNQTYLDLLYNLVETMGSKYGIYALMDMHQDLLSEKYCGEGVPLWAAVSRPLAHFEAFPEPFGKPFDLPSDGVPSKKDCDKITWSNYQATFAGASAYQSLYSNRDGLRDAFAAFWATVAAKFRDSQWVLGYELINEPFAGDFYKDPLLAEPGVADRDNLQPMYQQLATAIRAVDPNHVIFFEPVTWSDFGTGFTEIPGGPTWRNGSALSYHFYFPPQFDWDQYFNQRQKDMKRLGIGGMLTEFQWGGGDDDRSLDHIIHTGDICDQQLQGWIGWEYKSFFPITGVNSGLWDKDGKLLDRLAAVSARSFPIATQGNLISFNYTNSTGDFTITFGLDATIPQPTIIFASQDYVYTGGFDVVIAPPGAVTIATPALRNMVILQGTTGVGRGTLVTVSIKKSKTAA